MVIETEIRRSIRHIVKTTPFQIPIQRSKYQPKKGFRHRPSFRTKDQLRQEISNLKLEIIDLTSKLNDSIKAQIALKKKINFEVSKKIPIKRKRHDGGEKQSRKKVCKIDTSTNAKNKAMKRKSDMFDDLDTTHKRSKSNNNVSKLRVKRKAEDGGENPPPIKKYKIFTTKNVKQNIIKPNSELCYTNVQNISHLEKNITPNVSLQDDLETVVEKATKNITPIVSLQDRLDTAVEKVTMRNKQMWDSLRLKEVDDNVVDDEVQVLGSTNNNDSILNNEQDNDVETDIENEVIYIATPQKSHRKSYYNCSKCNSKFKSTATLNEHIYDNHMSDNLTTETKESPLSKQVKQEMFDNVDIRTSSNTLSEKDLNKVLQKNHQLMRNLK